MMHKLAKMESFRNTSQTVGFSNVSDHSFLIRWHLVPSAALYSNPFLIRPKVMHSLCQSSHNHQDKMLDLERTSHVEEIRFVRLSAYKQILCAQTTQLPILGTHIRGVPRGRRPGRLPRVSQTLEKLLVSKYYSGNQIFQDVLHRKQSSPMNKQHLPFRILISSPPAPA